MLTNTTKRNICQSPAQHMTRKCVSISTHTTIPINPHITSKSIQLFKSHSNHISLHQFNTSKIQPFVKSGVTASSHNVQKQFKSLFHNNLPSKPINNALNNTLNPSKLNKFNIHNINTINNSVKLPNNVKFALTIPFTTVTIGSIAAMPLAWTHALLGGSMIGGSASLFLLLNGRIAGISGIVSRCWDHIFTFGRINSVIAAPSQFGFLSGLLFGGWFVQNFLQTRTQKTQKMTQTAQTTQITHSTLSTATNNEVKNLFNKLYNSLKLNKTEGGPFKEIPFDSRIMLMAGILVGFGSRMGSGCTSGHGICGLARFSKRSITAVSTFMTTAVIAASLSNVFLNKYYHQSQFNNRYNNVNFNLNAFNTVLEQYSPVMSEFLVPILSFMLFGAAVSGALRRYQNERIAAIFPALFAGFLFANGLAISGMTQPTKVRDFLDFSTLFVNDVYKRGSSNMSLKQWAGEVWDPSLMFVMGGGLAVTMISFPLILRRMKPIFNNEFNITKLKNIDSSLVIGSSIFGIGWGLGGVCPGPGVVALGSSEYSANTWIWMIGLLLGMRLYPFARTLPIKRFVGGAM